MKRFRILLFIVVLFLLSFKKGSAQILYYDPTEEYLIKTSVESVLEQQSYVPNTPSVREDEPRREPDFITVGEIQSDREIECSFQHNAEKKYSIATAATFLGSLLSKNSQGRYTQFRCDDPYSHHIPLKAQEMYTLSSTWLPRWQKIPQRYSDEYIQCVTFVFMVYEMAGKSITKMGRTNADDFLHQKYVGESGQFTSFQSGNTTEIPQEGDLVVWSKERIGTPYGHVGVVVESRVNQMETEAYLQKKKPVEPILLFGTIRVVNANAGRIVYEYKYVVNESRGGKVKLEGVKNGWAIAPDYWLRKKDE